MKEDPTGTYRAIFELAPVVLWEEDFTEALAMLDQIKASGVTDVRAYLTAHPEVVAEIASKVVVLDVNRYSLELFEASDKAELIGSIDRLFVPETYSLFLDSLVAIAEGETTFAGDVYVGTLEGGRVYVHLTFTLLPPEPDRRRSLITITDISRRKQAEDELAAQERLYRTLTESIPHAIWMGDPDGRLTYCNHAMRDMLGVTLDEARGRDVMDDVHPDDREAVLDARSRAREAGAPFRGQCRFRSRDGGYRTVYFIDTPVRGAGGEVLSWVGVNTDITELKLIQEDRHRALERSNRDLAQFAYAASHDLQEPLRMVVSYSQLLEQRYREQLDARAHKYLDYMIEGAQRISALILDLLALSNVTQQGGPIQPVAAGEAFARASAAVSRDFELAGAVLDVDPLPTVMADSAQLTQVFRNLLENSLKFRGDQPLELRVTARRQDTMWRLSVGDNGIGLDEAAHGRRIFEMFRRLHRRDQYPGNGIGLTIAQKIVERHGGRIWVESRLGHGAVFHFTLPAVDVETVTES